MRKKFFRPLLLLSLFSSLGFTSPVYVDCEDPESDEQLGFLGIVKAVIPKTPLAAFLGLIPDSPMLQRLCSWHLSLHPFISVPVFSGPLIFPILRSEK